MTPLTVVYFQYKLYKFSKRAYKEQTRLERISIRMNNSIFKRFYVGNNE